MFNKNSIYFLISIGLIITIMDGCDKYSSHSLDRRISFLTNDSSKIWHVCKIKTKDFEVQPPSCLTDDKYEFSINGRYKVYKMGTTYNFNLSTDLFSPDQICKDTSEVIVKGIWTYDRTTENLTITTSDFTLSGQILSLSCDTFIINRVYRDTLNQIEYYITERNQ